MKSIKNLSKYAATSLITLIILCSATNSVSAHSSIITSPTTACGNLDSLDFATHASNQIDNRLAFASSTNGIAEYTARPTTSTSSVWTRNPNVWTAKGTPLNFTGVSGWNDNTGGAYQRGATLITPRHFIAANHFALPIGTNVVFLDTSGNPVVRRVVASTDILDSQGVDTDINVEALDSDVPDSITYYSILASTTLSSLFYKVTPQTLDVPIVTFNQDGSALVHSMQDAQFSFINHTVYASGSRAAYSQAIRGGDSGQPAFIVSDGQPILLFTHYSVTNGPNLGFFISQINTAISTMDSSGYQVTTYNPTCFTQYPVNHAPYFTASSTINTSPLSLDQSKFSTQVPVAFLTGYDPDLGQTFTISLTGLSSLSSSTTMPLGNYFSLDSTTNAIYQLAPIDTTIFGTSLSLGIKITDNAQYVASTTVNIRINIYNSINPNFTLDPTYSATLLGASSTPNHIMFDGSNKLYVDSFFPLAISNSTTRDGGIVRLTSTGTLDPTFTSSLSGINGIIISNSILQSDGKILFAGGAFTYGTSSTFFARLNNDGGIDTAFMNITGTGPNGSVRSVGIFNNQIIAAGYLTAFNGTSVPKIVRLNSDGSIDSTFSTNIGTGFPVRPSTLTIIQDGNQILMGGAFTSFNGTTIGNIIRLNANGTTDSAFAMSSGSGFNGAIKGLSLLSDGRIVAVGNFDSFNGSSTPNIALLNTDGTLNTQFAANVPSIINSSGLLSVYVQPDNKILIGSNGNTMTIGGRLVGTLARLNANGTLDSTFQDNIGIGVDGAVTSIAGRSDGAIAIAGLFNGINGQSSPRLALFRINDPVVTPVGGGSAAPTSGGGGGGGTTNSNNSNSNYTPATSTASSTFHSPSICIQGALFDITTGARCPASAISIATPSAWNFSSNLTLGTNSSNTKLLQRYLNSQGFIVATKGSGSIGNETTYFGPATKSALIKFQKAKGIVPASGYLGPVTRAYIAAH